MKRLFFPALIPLALSLSFAADKPTNALQAVEKERGAFETTLKTLVNIDAGKGNGEGLAKIEAILVSRLKELGASVETFHLDPGVAVTAVGNIVVGTFTGSGNKRIMLMIHYDTAFPKGEADGRKFGSDGKRATGPGVADAKGGVSIILHALKVLKDREFHDYGTLTVFFNPDEEQSSFGSRNRLKGLAARQDYVLSFEPAEGGGVAVGTNGIAWLQLAVCGRAAHASVPQEGVNALDEAVYQLPRLRRLGDANKETTVTWTGLQIGRMAPSPCAVQGLFETPDHSDLPTNRVPPYVEAIADMRYSDEKEVERVKAQAESITQMHLLPEAQVKVAMMLRRPLFRRNPQTEKLAQLAAHVYSELDRPGDTDTARAAQSFGTGGFQPLTGVVRAFGTDAGFAYNPQTSKPAVLEGLGLVGSGFHGTNEVAELDSIVPRLYLAVRMIEELSHTR